MLKPLQKIPKEQSLVAYSGVQFMDYGFRFEPNASFTRTFAEILDRRPDGSEYHRLRAVEIDRQSPTGGFIDAETKQPLNSTAMYGVQLRNALEIYDGAWLPAPFLKVMGRDHGRATFEQGPANWVRLRVTKLETPNEGDNTHRLIFAFDTQIEANPTYASPSSEDVRNGSEFDFAPALRDNSWFLDRNWVKGWLNAALEQGAGTKKLMRQDGKPAQCAEWAYYLVLLQGLASLLNGATGNAPMPTVRFVNAFGAAQVNHLDVDLVLDIGNSRTCGVLIEIEESGDLSIDHATVLELRDLSRPEFAYQEPFRSHIEFVRPEFGSAFWSAEGGREHALHWPSWVRVGPEALRLNGKSAGAEGDTGLSGPKRYLWDERENRQAWYFNVAEAGGSTQTPVSGELLLFLTQAGEPIEWAGAGALPALHPRFSRASLFMFLVMELLLQALVQMNSPSYRARTRYPGVPRRLRRVVFTIPTATPLVERERYQRRCEAAAKLLWKSLGWDQVATIAAGQPEVNIAYDEATCTQIVFLYNEVIRKFGKAATDFFKVMGNGDGRRLRIASVDIGGGTTDLMITTYEVGADGNATNPVQNFREGFRRAGDDILEAVLIRHVIEPLIAALGSAGMAEPRDYLKGLLLAPVADAQHRQFRKLLVSRVLASIALALLAQYESAGMFQTDRDPITLEGMLGSDADSLRHVIESFDERAHKAGAQDFTLGKVAFPVDFTGIGATAQGVIGPILSIMCEVIHKFSCDVFLISGRPSRLPIVRDLVLRLLPAMPNRMIFMHDYRVGQWYPFASRHGTIQDPKTTVVVGALLCALAEEAKIADFSLSTAKFKFESTANYIGRVFVDGSIADANLIFAPEKGMFPTESKPVTVSEPLFLGFRQMALERWPGTPLYFIDIPAAVRNQFQQSKPWTVTFCHPDPPAKAGNEAFGIERIEDKDGQQLSNGSLQMRLQTLRNADGYWLDTGVVSF
jgi:hypothetical protein